jgi:hypothetical protein
VRNWKLLLAAVGLSAALAAPILLTAGHSADAVTASVGRTDPTTATPTDAPTASPTATPTSTPTATAPTAEQLLAKVKSCDNPVTKSPLQTDEDAPSDVNVCGLKGAVFMKADMDIDCDGQETDQCNSDTDCCFQNDTTFHQSNGDPLNSAELPYIVLPEASDNWDWKDNGIDGGSVVAVIYNNKVSYAVFGDTDSPNKAGEASYATAKSLGIDPDPKSGGVDDGVTYIVFSDTTAKPIESHDSAVTLGEQAAQEFIAAN